MKCNKKGFTLIELLVVIAIIGVVLALLLPAILRAPEAANLERCKAEVNNLNMALIAYEAEYHVWPNGGDDTSFNSTMVQILSGMKTNPGTDRKLNPNCRIFVDISNVSTNSTGALVDPWGREYQCRMDKTYKNSVQGPSGLLEGRTTAVWSLGPDNDIATIVKSW